MKKDILIVGQGLAGTVLSWELLDRGFSIEIRDQHTSDTSSMKAAGLFNPITGRNMTKTWLADELFTSLMEYYPALERRLDEHFFHPLPMYRPFTSTEEFNDWSAKYQESPFVSYIDSISSGMSIDGLANEFGGLNLLQTGYVDLPVMLEAAGERFNELGLIKKVKFSPHEEWKQIANRIIFCDGSYATSNPYWQSLPFRPVRGELLDIECSLPPDRIYNRSVFMIPRSGVFRIGSTYDHKVLSYEPQSTGIEQLKQKLRNIFTGDYEIKAAYAGVRPATHDRRPYIGWHPENKAVGIFNGFGTKGVSLVPYFSKLFVDSIEGKTGIHPEANVSRVI